MPKQNQVVTFVLEQNGSLLMEWREDGPFAPGCLAFPGGKIEPGESVTRALMREVAEELGVVAQVAKELPEFVSATSWTVHPYFISKWFGTLPTKTDAGDPLIWVSLERALQSTWSPAVRIAEMIKERGYAREAGNDLQHAV